MHNNIFFYYIYNDAINFVLLEIHKAKLTYLNFKKKIPF